MIPANYYYRFSEQLEEVLTQYQVWESVNLVSLQRTFNQPETRGDLILHKATNQNRRENLSQAAAAAQRRLVASEKMACWRFLGSYFGASDLNFSYIMG